MRTQELNDYLNSIPEDSEYTDFEFYTLKVGWELIVHTKTNSISIMWYLLEDEIIAECEDYADILNVSHEYSFVFKFKVKTIRGDVECIILDLETKIEELS